ncbi:hypothetical protein niasHT_006931 [Heterodera trifolii]
MNTSAGNKTNIVIGDEVIYVPFVISIFGLIGNFLTFITIIKTNLRKNYVNKYILVLLASDSLVLLSMFVRMFVNLDTVSFALCFSVRFTWNTAIYVSNFAIISLTIERFFAIVYPLQHLRYSGLNRWKVICAWLFLLLLISCHHFFALRKTAHDSVTVQFSSTGSFKCSYDTERKFVDVIFHFPRLLLQFILTFVVVIVVNIFIIIKLRSRYVIIGETGPGEMRATNVLLAVVPFVYVLFNFMYNLKNFLKFFQTNKSQNIFLEHHYWFVVGSYFLFCANFALNFILYSMISPVFRKEFCRKWLRKRATIRPRSTTMTTKDVQTESAKKSLQMKPIETKTAAETII